MKLRLQTYTITGFPFLILLIILIIASWFMVRGSFRELEREHAQIQVRQILVHLNTLMNQVAQTTRDWAAWDETYRFVQDGNEAYRRDNLNDPSLVNLDLNALVFMDRQGRMVNSLGWDGAARRQVPVMPGLLELLRRRGDLLREVMELGPVKGIISLPSVPLALAMHPILKSNNRGPAAGVLVMARTMREVDLGHIQEMFGARLDIYRSDPVQTGAPGPPTITVSPLNADMVAGITTLPGLPGEQPIALKVSLPRNIFKLGERTTLYFLGWLALTALVMAAAASYVLDQRVTKRITVLTERVGDITRSEDQSLRLPVSGADELAGLAYSVNQMLAALQEANEEAARAARRYQGILEDQTELICRFDREHRLTFANEAFRRYFSLPPGYVPGGSLEALLPTRDLAEMLALLDSLSGRDDVTDAHIPVERNDGSQAWLHVTVRAIPDQGGRVREYQMMGLDATEQLLAVRALKDSENRYRTLFERAGESIFIVEGEGEKIGRIVAANKTASRVFGYTTEEFVRMSVADLVDPSLAPGVTHTLRRMMRGSWASREMAHLTKQGLPLIMEVSAGPVELEGRKYLLSLVRDITERKKADNALRESEARLRAILEANPDPAVVYDNQGRVTYLNPAFTSVFGWTFEELAGKRIDFMPEDQRELSLGQIRMLYETGTPANFETVRFTKEGRRLEVHISAAGISGPDGGVAGMVVNITDITERKRMSAQLLRSQKMEAVGNLAGGIAHDFNNVLQVIRGYAQLAVWESGASRGLGAYATEIEKAASRGADLVQRLLAFSRKLEPELKPVDLNREVSDAAVMLERIIPKMISITTRLAEGLDIIDADPTQLEQILLNLGTNARDAMPGGGALTLETENIELDETFCQAHPPLRPGLHVLLTVSDTGQGMDPEVRDHIFEPFFTTKGQGEGTGMGLASVYGIVEAHRGHINCYSEPDQGTVFRIYLPAHRVADGQSREPAAEPEGLPGGDETVLLVDDEPGVRNVGRMLLDKSGYTVLTASSGEEALEVLTKGDQEPQLVILDLNMPGMGGRRCLEEIKRIDPSLPVMVASGYTDTGQMDKILSAGAAAFVGKPFRLHHFLNTVRQVLDEAGKSRSPGDQERLSRSM